MGMPTAPTAPIAPGTAPSGRSRYLVSYDGAVQVGAAPSQVWAALENLEAVREWSAWVDRIDMVPDHLESGTVLSVSIVTPLPFRVRVQMVIGECVADRLIVAAVDGDLRGSARLRLNPDGAATRGEVSWSLEMRHGAMRAMAVMAGPLLRWGHDVVAEATIASLTRRIEEAAGPARPSEGTTHVVER